MPHYRYLIVGGGMTADAAVRGIRSLDEDGSVGIVAEEGDAPYDRPLLSKGLWKEEGGADPEKADRGTEELDVDLHLDRRVERIDPDEHSVTDDRGGVYTYDRLLLATGGRPRKLDDAPPQVTYFRTLADYRKVRKQLDRGAQRFAVIGGSFIGSEMAAALRRQGAHVTLLFPEEAICRTVLPPSLASGLNDYYRQQGVTVMDGVGVASVRRSGDMLLLATEEEAPSETLRVDGVVAGIGIVPNQELAETAGLEVAPEEEGGGIEVNRRLQTSAPDVYAAGDVAAIWSTTLGARRRVEHEDQANTSGFHAGQAMVGSEEPYDHLPFFYSDLFDAGYEAVGITDPELETVEDWADGEPGVLGTGVIYYLAGGRIRGVVLWNHFGHLGRARELIRSEERRKPRDLPGLIDLDV